MLRELVVLFALTSVVLATTSLAPHQKKPDEFKNVEGCYVDVLDEVIPLGKSASSKRHCMEYRCGEEYLEIVECGSPTDVPPCKLVEDHSKHFPNCCVRHVC